MRVQMLLFAGTLAGVSLLAGPALSQDSPRTSPPQPRPSSPGMGGQNSAQMQALNSLLGTWEVTVKTFDGGGSAQPNPASQSQGTSTRAWLFDGKILKEDVRCQIRTLSQAPAPLAEPDDEAVALAAVQGTPPGSPPGNPPTTPPSRPGTPPQPRPETPPSTPPRDIQPPPSRGLDSGSAFSGHGMFGFDPQMSKFEHIWCDNTSSNISVSTGVYDESAKTFTFTVQGAGGTMPSSPTRSPSATPPSSPTRPPVTPPSEPGKLPDDDDTTDPGDDDENPLAQAEPRPGSPPSPTTPPRPNTPSPRPSSPPSGSGATPTVDMTGLDKVVIRIQGNDRHTVEYYRGSSKIMELAYTKSR